LSADAAPDSVFASWAGDRRLRGLVYGVRLVGGRGRGRRVWPQRTVVVLVPTRDGVGRVYRRCACRDRQTGRQWGARCPRRVQQSHGRWYFSVRVSAVDGARVRIRRGGFAHRSQAEGACRELLRLPGAQAAARTWTVRRFLEFWLSKQTGRLRATTVRGYRWIVDRYLIPVLGRCRLSGLHVRDVQRAVDQVCRLTVRSGRLIAPSSVHRIVAVLRTALAEARRLGMIGHNPAWRLWLPAAARPGPVLWDERRVRAWRNTGVLPRVATWDVPHLARFLEAVRDDWLFPLWWLVALRGPRRGEVAGLRWPDLDLIGKEMTIREQVIVIDGVEHVGPPKSAAGVRTVALDEVTVRILAAWQAHLRRRGLFVPDGRVFVRPDGATIRPDWLTRRFHQLVRQLDLPPVRLHDLRHAAATLALAAGADLKVVQQEMGHSRAMTTLDTYAVVISQVAQAAARAAAQLLLSQARIRVPIEGAYEA